jgi:hypothetical protein
MPSRPDLAPRVQSANQGQKLNVGRKSSRFMACLTGNRSSAREIGFSSCGICQIPVSGNAVYQVLGFFERRSFLKSDSCLTPFRSILSTHREPRQASDSGDGSTVPEAIRSSLFPCSSASASRAVRIIPACKETRFPSVSSQVSSWERHSNSPNNPLKSARTRIGFDCVISATSLPCSGATFRESRFTGLSK